MIDTILQILYILIAIAMAVLILLQRGAGAQAGSGFGAGASGTVFGARGSGNFLSKSTKWLAVGFFSLALFMAWKAVNLNSAEPASADLGVMGAVPAAPPAVPSTQPQASTALPAVPETQPAVVTPQAPATDAADGEAKQ